MKYSALLCLFWAGMCVPASAQQQADSVVWHFWDSLPVEEYVSSGKEVELISFVMEDMPAFVGLLSEGAAAADVVSAYNAVMARAEASEAESLWHCLRDMAEGTFHGPNSVARNDEVFIGILEKTVESRYMSASDSARYASLLHMMKKSRVGAVAANIALRIERMCLAASEKEYVGRKRKTVQLSELCCVDSTVVLFYDPECEHCMQEIGELRRNEHLAALCREGRWRVVLVNVEPKSRLEGGWKSMEPIPEGWVLAVDRAQAVVRHRAYYLPFVPQLYILDRKMTVVGRAL